MALAENVSETELAHITLTKNQEKVIRDKYLKDDPSPEAWLYRVAKNIALAEVLYVPKINREKLFDGVNHAIEKIETLTGHITGRNLRAEKIRKQKAKKVKKTKIKYHMSPGSS